MTDTLLFLSGILVGVIIGEVIVQYVIRSRTIESMKEGE
jgi:F0F1-type ATP synthase assembly protein I